MELTKSEIMEKIDSVKNSYHQIEIRPGIITPGVNNSRVALERLKISDDCSGLRVLDLGTRDGFFAFELERRGAAEVIAVDYFPPDKAGFNVAAELLNSKVTFIQDNIYTISKEKYGTFDIVLCLGLLYHLRDPLLALDIIRSVCTDMLYLETYVIDNAFLLSDGNKVLLHSISKELQDIPIMQFYPRNSLNKDFTNYWGPNSRCVELMLVESNFSVIERKVFKDRGIFKCRVGFDKNLEYFQSIARGILGISNTGGEAHQ